MCEARGYSKKIAQAGDEQWTSPRYSGPAGRRLCGFQKRFDLRVRRHGNAVILEPIATDWAWLDALVGPLDEDFVSAVAERQPEQTRPAIDFFA